MNPGDLFPLRCFANIDPGAYDIFHRSAQGGDGGRYLVEYVNCLCGRIAWSNAAVRAVRRSRAGDMDGVFDPKCPAVAGYRFPNASGRSLHATWPAGDLPGCEDRG